MSTTDNALLRRVEANARRRVETEAPKAMGSAAPAEPPVFVCRVCGKRVPIVGDGARNLGRLLSGKELHGVCRACGKAETEREREAEQRRAVELQRAEAERIRADPPGVLAGCGVPAAWRGASLDRCPDLPVKLVDAAREWSLDPIGIVLIGGAVGSGKTTLAVGMAREALLAGSASPGTTRYVGERAYLDALKAAFDADGETPRRPDPRDPTRARLLVLDDVGSAYLTPWGRGEIAGLIERRHGEGLPTILTSNLPLDALASAIDQRVASRIAEWGNVWALTTRDLRRSGTARAVGDYLNGRPRRVNGPEE